MLLHPRQGVHIEVHQDATLPHWIAIRNHKLLVEKQKESMGLPDQRHRAHIAKQQACIGNPLAKFMAGFVTSIIQIHLTYVLCIEI